MNISNDSRIREIEEYPKKKIITKLGKLNELDEPGMMVCLWEIMVYRRHTRKQQHNNNNLEKSLALRKMEE